MSQQVLIPSTEENNLSKQINGYFSLITLAFVGALLAIAFRGGQQNSIWQPVETVSVDLAAQIEADFLKESPIPVTVGRLGSTELRTTAGAVVLVNGAVLFGSGGRQEAPPESLCGQEGCLVVGYQAVESGWQQVFQAHLDPYLPPETVLVTASPESGCLTTHQMSAAGKLIQQTHCFNGQRFAAQGGND